MAEILVLGTGGTIAQMGRGRAEIAIATLAQGHPVRTRQICQVTSVNLGADDLAGIHAAICEAMADPAVAGVVLTHGTDTLEETAFLLSQTLRPAKPLVLTGAMRPAGAAAPDGPENLAAAIRAAGRLAPGLHVAFGDRILPGIDVMKRHATARGAMVSPHLGGAAPGPLPAPLPWPVRWPRVAVLPVHLMTQAEDWPMEDPTLAGAVIAGTGAGTIPDRLHAATRALSARMPVLRASRTGAGFVGAGGEMDDAALGTLPAGWLPPVKARLLLSLTLAAGLDRAAIADRLHQISQAYAAMGASDAA